MALKGVSIPITVENKTAEGLNQARDDIKGFNARIKSDTAIELSLKVGQLQADLAEMKKNLKQAIAEGNKDAEIVIRADIARLSQELTQGTRELRNFTRTGNADMSVLGKLFDSVNGSIDRTRQEILKLGGSTQSLDGLVAKMDSLQKEFIEGKISAQQYGMAMNGIEKEMKDLQTNAGQSQGVMGGLGNTLKSTVGMLGGLALAYSGFNFLKQASSDAMEFESGLANINTIAQLTQEELAGLGTQISDVSVKLGIARIELTNAGYDMASAGIQAQNTAPMLDLMGRAAIAGNTSMSEAFAGTSAVVKAYNLDISQTPLVMDKLFKANELGQTTFGALSNAIQGSASIAYTAGVSLDELSAVYATLTGVTGDASEVTTQFTAMTNAIIKPSSEAEKVAKSYGITLDASAIKQKGLVGVLKEMQDKTQGNTRDMATMLGGVQALKGASALTTAQYAKFTDNLNQAKNSLGSLDRAYVQNADTTERQLNRNIEKYNGMKIAVGDTINNILKWTMSWVGSNQQAFANIANILYWAGRLFLGLGKDIMKTLSQSIGLAVLFAVDMGKIFSTVFSNLAKVTTNGLSNVMTLFTNVFNDINGFSKGVFDMMAALGENMVEGIITGLSGLSTAVYNSVLDAVGSIPGGADAISAMGIKKGTARKGNYRSVTAGFAGTNLTKGMVDITAGTQAFTAGNFANGMKNLDTNSETMQAVREIMKAGGLPRIQQQQSVGQLVDQGGIVQQLLVDGPPPPPPGDKRKGSKGSKKSAEDETKNKAEQAKREIDIETEKQKRILSTKKGSEESIKRLEEDALLRKLEIDKQYAKSEQDKADVTQKIELEKEKITTDRLKRTGEMEKKSAEERKKIQEDLVNSFSSDYKKLSDDLEKSNETIKKHREEIGKIQEKWKEVSDEARKEINKVNASIAEVNYNADKKLADRFLQIEEEITKKKDEITKTQSEDEKKKLQEKLKALETEKSLITSNLTSGEIQTARDEAKKSESQKIIESRDKEVASLEERKKVAEAFSNSTLEQKKIQISEEDGLTKAYYQNEEGKMIEIKDKKNIEFAENLQRKKDELANAILIKQQEIDAENEIIKKGLAVREQLYKNFLDKIKQEGLNAFETGAMAETKLAEKSNGLSSLTPDGQVNKTLNDFQATRGTTQAPSKTTNKSVNIGNVVVNNGVDADSLLNTISSKM